MTLDAREFGLAPRLQELTPAGQMVYTLAGVMTAVGVKHRATLYSMLWLMGLRRNFGSEGKPIWRWLQSDVETAMKNRPRCPSSGTRALARKLASAAKERPSMSMKRKRAGKTLDVG